MSTANLGVRIVLQDGASSGLGALGMRFGLLSGMVGLAYDAFTQLDPVVQALGVIAGVSGLALAGFGGAIFYAVDQAANLQDQMANIEVAVDGANTHFNQLQQTLVQVSDNSIFSTSQVAEAFVALGQHGQDATAIINGVGQAAIFLAEATRSETTPAAALLGQTMQMFNMNASQSEQVANALAFAFEHGVPSVSDLSSAIAQAGPAAAALGIPLSQLIPVLDYLAQRMGSGSKAGVALAYMLSALQDPTNKAMNELAQLGVVVVNRTNPAIASLQQELENSGGAAAKAANQYNGSVGSLDSMYLAAQKVGLLPTTETFMQWATSSGALSDKLYDANGNFKGMNNMLNVIFDTISKLNPQQQALAIQQLFNVKSGKGAMDMIHDWQQGKLTLANYEQELAKYSAEGNAEIKTNTLSGAVNRLHTNFQSLMAAVGQADLGPLQTVFGGISTLLGKLHDASGLTKLGGAILNIGLVASSAIFGISGFSFGLGAFKKIAASGEAKKLAQGFGDLLSPLRSLITGGNALGQAWGRKLIDVFTGLKGNAQAALYGLRTGFSSLRGGIVGAFSKLPALKASLGQFFTQELPSFLKYSGIHLMNLRDNAADTFVRGFAALRGGLGTALGAVKSGIGSMAVSAVNAIPAILGLGASLLPIIIIVAAIAGAIAVGVLLFTKYHKQGQQLATLFMGMVGPALKSIGAMLGGVGQSIEKQWVKVEPQVTVAMKGVVSAFKNAQPFFQLLINIIAGAVKLIIGVVGGLVTGLISALPMVINVFTAIINVIGDVTHIVIDLFTGQWGKIPALLGQTFHDLLSIVGNAGGALLTLGGHVIGGLVIGLLSGIGQIVPIPKKLFASIVNGVKSLFGIASPSKVMLGLGTNIVQGLLKGIEALAGGLGKALTVPLGTLLSTTESDIKASLTRILTGLVTWVGSVTTGFGKLVTGLPAQALSMGIQLLTTIGNFELKLLSGLLSFVTRALVFWGNLEVKALQFVAQLVVGVLVKIGSLELQGIAKVASLVSGVLGYMGALPGRVLGFLGSLVSQGIAKFESLRSTAITKIQNLASALASVGPSIVQGLMNGIASLPGRLGSFLANAAQQAVNRLKNVLGISSPSRVMQQLGIWTSQGMLNGVTSVNVAQGAANHWGKVADAARSTLGTLSTPSVASAHASAAYGGHGGVSGDVVVQVVTPDGKTLAQQSINRLTGQLKSNGFGRKIHAMKR